MRGKQTILFTVSSDIQPIAEAVESNYSVQYFMAGMFDNQNIPHYSSILEFPDMGQTFFGDWNRIGRYLVMPKSTILKIRQVDQNAGGIKFAVDQMLNQDSVEIKIGGIYKDKDNFIVAGRVGTISETDFSNSVYKAFVKEIKKNFRYIDGFYVSKGAEEKLQSGWRLVTNEKLSKGFDLVMSN